MNKLDTLQKILRDSGSALIAYSGGTDSSLLLAVASQVLGKNILAVTAVSDLMTKEEIDEAQSIANNLGVRHLLLPVDDLKNPDFAANTPERCYHCKKQRFVVLKEIALKYNLNAVLDGSNLDDLKDYRPGHRAIHELGIKSPLLEAGMTKADIRLLAKQLGLPNWNKSAQACLASRIPYGTTITKDLLERIGKAESCLRELFPGQQIRVRDYGQIALLEVPPESFPTIITYETAQTICKELKMLGYSQIALDLQGYRQGSTNENILKKQE